MSSREQILQRIRNLNLEAAPLPEIPSFSQPSDLIGQFKKMLAFNHAEVVEAGNDLTETLTGLLSDYKNIVSCVEGLELSSVLDADLTNRDVLDSIEAVIVKGEIGVAENAAIWIPEKNVKSRILSFITLHYFVVLSEQAIVANMHEAYSQIKEIPGFGAFIAGPSKTADIEQSLVIGAHGPKRLTVVLIKN